MFSYWPDTAEYLVRASQSDKLIVTSQGTQSNLRHTHPRAGYFVWLRGGMRPLVRLDEETTWIHRSWTLLEAPILRSFSRRLVPSQYSHLDPERGRRTFRHHTSNAYPWSGSRGIVTLWNAYLGLNRQRRSLLATAATSTQCRRAPYRRFRGEIRMSCICYLAVRDDAHFLPSSRHDTQRHGCVSIPLHSTRTTGTGRPLLSRRKSSSEMAEPAG